MIFNASEYEISQYNISQRKYFNNAGGQGTQRVIPFR